MTDAAVEIIGITKKFGPLTALAGIDLQIGAGEFVSLLGASGCGKSTLLRIIAGFETASAGAVRIYGEDVTRRPPERRPTNLVFQRGALFPHMSVAENIGYALRLRGWDRRRLSGRVEEMLALVRLEGLGARLPSQLSGGQAQRVALARALAGEPRVLLLDEPLSALDFKLRQQMQLELRSIQRRLGATFVFVTHDQTEALVMSDRIAIMNRGQIVQVGSPREIYRRPATAFVSDFVGATNLLAGVVAETDGDVLRLDTPSGPYLVRLTGSAPARGAPAALSLRPESIRISRDFSPPSGRGVTGTIADIVYQGAATRVGAQIVGGQILWADLRDDEAEGLAPGDTVTLHWAENAATLVQEDPG
jgi:spermidine/putrescine ABC transporter ATP-binding subunit